MSDLVPTPHFDGIVRVVKLINGDELIGIVRDATVDKIVLTLPAKIENSYTRDEEGNMLELVKLTNYAINVYNFEININRNSVMYIASPVPELNKMYDVFFTTMKTDPSSIITNSEGEVFSDPQEGLKLLNELFNNEDFVNFVNDLVENFEEEGIFEEILGEDEEEQILEDSAPLLPESSINDPSSEQPKTPPKKKKRSRIKPTTTELPFNPEANPNSAEGWSDNPEDYI
jgi:hypothetical protein